MSGDDRDPDDARDAALLDGIGQIPGALGRPRRAPTAEQVAEARVALAQDRAAQRRVWEGAGSPPIDGARTAAGIADALVPRVVSARPGPAAGVIDMTMASGARWRLVDAGADAPPVVWSTGAARPRVVGRILDWSTAPTLEPHPGAVGFHVEDARAVAPALGACWAAWRRVDAALVALAEVLDSVGEGWRGEQVLELGVVALASVGEELAAWRMREQPSIRVRWGRAMAADVRPAYDAAVAAARAAGYRVGS